MPRTVFFRNYVRDNPITPGIHQFPYGVAYFSADRWWYSGINYGGQMLPVPIDQQDIDSLKAWVTALFHDPEPMESEYRPGTAYKRIVLPLATGGNLNQAINVGAMTQSFVALKLLIAKMQDVFESVEPSESNQRTYGHKIRELLLLASMEVEASWAAVLKANGYVRDRYTTNDYVKLLEPMMLDRPSLKLKSYPDFPVLTPFKGWTASLPTQSLDWYNAYNLTKHNREEHLGEATLQRAITAVAAVAVLFSAQFANRSNIEDEKDTLIRNVFSSVIDSSMYPTACYIPNAGGGTEAWEWELTNYPFA